MWELRCLSERRGRVSEWPTVKNATADCNANGAFPIELTTPIVRGFVAEVDYAGKNY